MMKIKEDADLMNSIKNGDEVSFSIFYKKEYPQSLYYATQYLHSKTLAEDVVQDSFIALWEKRSYLDPAFPIQSYFYSIIKHRCLNVLRKLANDRKVKDLLLQREYRASIVSLTDESADILVKMQLEEFIKKTIEELPEHISTSFILNRDYGMTYQEIADNKGVTVKVVEYHITQALKLFRRRLKDFLPEE